MLLPYYYNDDDIEVGVDEVGRGCLAGPVYAGAVVWPKHIDDPRCELIKDSKKLSESKREMLYDFIHEVALSCGVGIVTNTEVDKINILNASYKAMHLALDELSLTPDIILVDGNMFKNYIDNRTGVYIPHISVVDGDNLYMSIAAASIIAKVSRDRYMKSLSVQYPRLGLYDWVHNKGYGTKKHREAITRYGLSTFHRKTFGLCKSITQTLSLS